jgi:hypothetical protein
MLRRFPIESKGRRKKLYEVMTVVFIDSIYAFARLLVGCSAEQMLPWGVSAQKILLECWYIPVIVNNIILIDAWVYLVDLFSLVPVLVLVTECANFAFINCLSGWNRDSDLLYLLSDKMHCGEYTHLVLFAQLMCIFFFQNRSTFTIDAFLITGTKHGHSDSNM